MHICFISHEYPLWSGGGIGSFIKTLGYRLVNEGHQVSVVGTNTVSTDEILTDSGIKIYRVACSSWVKLKFIVNSKNINKKIWQIHKEFPIDIIESSELGLAFIDVNFPAKKIIRMHGGHHFFSKMLNKELNFWKAWIEKRSFKKSDSIVAVSRFVGEKTINLLGLINLNFTIIPNPVDTQIFHLSEKKNVSDGTILFVGTVCEKKGLCELIEAFHIINRRRYGLKLIIVGRDWFHPETGLSFMEYLHNRYSSEYFKNVTFTGQVKHDEVPKYIEGAQICVLPSHMEAMPIAWLEVLAAGKPLVASSTGPGPEAVIDGVTGYLCNPYDPKDIAAKISLLLDDPIKAILMGESARRDIINRFSIDRIVNLNIDYYKSVCIK